MAGLSSGENQDAFLPRGGGGTMACRPVREAVGMLQDEPFLGAAVDDRLLSGVDGADIAVAAGRRLSVHTVDRDGEIPACRILKRQAALPTAWGS